MRTKLYDYDTMHIKQIPTTYRRIYQELMCNEFSKLLLKSFSYKPGSNEYMLSLTLASISLEQISRLVYKNKDKKYVKLPEAKYKYWLFEGDMETEEEVFESVKKLEINESNAIIIHKKVWQIADIVCPMMACAGEQAFIHEYAFAMDYVIRHRGDLPKPKMTLLFPDYPNYMEELRKSDIVKYINNLSEVF